MSWEKEIEELRRREALAQRMGGLEAAYKAEIEAAADREAKRAEIEARLRRFASPLRSAWRFDIEEIIDPRDTRPLLCEFAELAAPLRTPGRSSFGLRP
jgi:acetyl-CoA carboxylase carboxyltransferase component